MKIPETAYLTGILEVSEKDEFDAKEAARDYHANRTVCLATQKKLPVYRFCFFAMLIPLFCYFIDEFFQKDLGNYMAVISMVYTPVAVYFALFRKELRIPAVGSLIYLAEVFRLDDWTAIIPTWIPILILNVIAFFYDRDRKWLAEQPGFPEFRDITVRVKEQYRLNEREIPPLSEPADDPFADVLGALSDEKKGEYHASE